MPSLMNRLHISICMINADGISLKLQICIRVRKVYLPVQYTVPLLKLSLGQYAQILKGMEEVNMYINCYIYTIVNTTGICMCLGYMRRRQNHYSSQTL